MFKKRKESFPPITPLTKKRKKESIGNIYMVRILK